MTGKRKWIIGALAVLAAALAGYLLFGRSDALELFPEEIWQQPHDQTVFLIKYLFDEGEKGDLDEQRLQTLLAEADLWRIPDWKNNYPGGPCILLNLSADTGDYTLWAGENGYILFVSDEQPAFPSLRQFMKDFFGGAGRETRYSSRWYRDDGSLYRSLMKLMEE